MTIGTKDMTGIGGAYEQSAGKNHNQRGLAVRTGVRAGAGTGYYEPPCGKNHNQRGLAVRTGVRAGSGGGYYEPPCGRNHNQRGLAVRKERMVRRGPNAGRPVASGRP